MPSNSLLSLRKRVHRDAEAPRDDRDPRARASAVRADRELRSVHRVDEDRFRALSASSASPVGIFITDAAGHCTYVSSRCQKLMGLAEGASLASWWEQLLSAQDRLLAWRDWLTAVRRGIEYARECKLGTADGRVRDLYIRSAPIRSSSGELIGQVGMAEDVTERRRSEEQIRFQASLLDAVGQSVIATDREARVRYWNAGAEKLYGWTAAEAVGRDVVELTLPPEARGQIRAAIVKSVLSEKGWSGESIAYHRDGRIIPVLCTVSPIHDIQGVVDGMVATVQDISERKRLEDELTRKAQDLTTSDRLKDEFLSMLAHELRNPLAPILHALESLRLCCASEEIKHAHGVAERQVRHMSRLLDDLLDVSRITRGAIELRPKPLDLASAMADAVEASRPLIEARRHDLSMAIPSPSIWIEADEDRIVQIITNLINNAAKYTQPGGRIHLSVERVEQSAVIRVRDTGVGIAPDLLTRIFDLFAQASRSPDRALGGLGIGLTVARRLVELHGGTLEAHSDGAGRGSEFVVRLPHVIARPVEERRAPTQPTATLGKRRVLVVEDNLDAAETLANLLRFRGHDALVVHDGKAALEAIDNHRPDVVLMDIGLPEMDGYQVARQLARCMGRERPLLIAMTGYGQERDRLRAREAGFDYHIVKPVGLQTIEAVLRRPPAETSLGM